MKSKASLIRLVLQVASMRIRYDDQTDTLTIKLRDARAPESDEVRPGTHTGFRI
jgi:hypothetical protein